MGGTEMVPAMCLDRPLETAVLNGSLIKGVRENPSTGGKVRATATQNCQSYQPKR